MGGRITDNNPRGALGWMKRVKWQTCTVGGARRTPHDFPWLRVGARLGFKERVGWVEGLPIENLKVWKCEV